MFEFLVVLLLFIIALAVAPEFIGCLFRLGVGLLIVAVVLVALVVFLVAAGG